MASPDAAHLETARRLAAKAGCARPIALHALTGGRNNRVYRVDTEAGPPLILKSYFRDPRDTRDRRAAEWAFLAHAWQRGVRAIPEPFATDVDDGVSLMGFVEGRRLATSAVAPVHVEAAIDFVLAVNGPPRDTGILPPASEACFSLAEHLATVERRVARLAYIDRSAPLANEAALLISTTLGPAWQTAKARIEAVLQRSGSPVARPLSAAQTCLSPSDFGFHNALIGDDGRVVFLDFEYAGRDDPAKLVSDFFCQPEIPIPIAHHAGFIANLAAGLGLDADFAERAVLLLDAYRIKWACIMLNEFMPVGAARRAFAATEERAARCAVQLVKVRTAVAAID